MGVKHHLRTRMNTDMSLDHSECGDSGCCIQRRKHHHLLKPKQRRRLSANDARVSRLAVRTRTPHRSSTPATEGPDSRVRVLEYADRPTEGVPPTVPLPGPVASRGAHRVGASKNELRARDSQGPDPRDDPCPPKPPAKSGAALEGPQCLLAHPRPRVGGLACLMR